MERYVAQLVVRIFSICKDFPCRETYRGGTHGEVCCTVGCKDSFHL